MLQFSRQRRLSNSWIHEVARLQNVDRPVMLGIWYLTAAEGVGEGQEGQW